VSSSRHVVITRSSRLVIEDRDDTLVIGRKNGADDHAAAQVAPTGIGVARSDFGVYGARLSSGHHFAKPRSNECRLLRREGKAARVNLPQLGDVPSLAHQSVGRM
jgi:hypothetical protein